MVALGLILLVLCGAATAGVVMQNTDPAALSVFGQSVSGLTTGTLFLAGVITGALGLLGLMLMFAGASRRRRRRLGRKQEMRAAYGEKETLAEENARLQRELAARSGSDVYPTEGGRHAEQTETTGRHGLFRR